MPNIVVDINALRSSSNSSSSALPKEAARILFKTKSKFISSIDFQSIEKVSIFKSRASITHVKFSHNLVKSGENQWHVIENKSKGIGGFGAVNESKLKIIVEKTLGSYTAKFLKVNDVIKIQKPSNVLKQSALLLMAQKEANKQSEHQVKVINVVDAGDKVITIVEDCGISLDNLLPFTPANAYSFKYRFEIAARIASEMLLLQHNEVVHRDLKPGNICLKTLPNGNFQIIFIDFGLASNADSDENLEISGTYPYMAPEAYEGRGSSYASDMYALAAILGELFGAKDILKYKIAAFKNSKKNDDLVYSRFSYDGIFEGYDVSGIDPYFLEDLKTLLIQLASKAYKARPSIHVLNKFLITAPARLDEYDKFNTVWEKMVTLFTQFEDFHVQLHLLKTKHSLNKVRENEFYSLKIPKNVFNSALLINKAVIYKALTQLPLPKSHFTLSKQLIRENRLVDFEDEDNPYPDLKPIIRMLEDENLKFQKALSGFDRCTNAFIGGNKFAKTNSTGIIKISNILRSKASAIVKLQQLQEIGLEKTEKGFWHYYSHSSIFGKGRHKNVDELYKKLALINPEDSVNEEDYLAQKQLEEITQFIENTDTFTH